MAHSEGTPFLPVEINVGTFGEDMMKVIEVIKPLWPKEDIVFKVRHKARCFITGNTLPVVVLWLLKYVTRVIGLKYLADGSPSVMTSHERDYAPHHRQFDSLLNRLLELKQGIGNIPPHKEPVVWKMFGTMSWRLTFVFLLYVTGAIFVDFPLHVVTSPVKIPLQANIVGRLDILVFMPMWC